MLDINSRVYREMGGCARTQIKQHLLARVSRLATNKFIVDENDPVIPALRSAAQVLRQQFPKAYLGMALGGSRNAGLHSDFSDIDCVVYLNRFVKSSKRVLYDLFTRIQSSLGRHIDLWPCDFEDPEEIDHPELPAYVYRSYVMLSPFADLIIDGDEEALQLAAIRLFRQAPTSLEAQYSRMIKTDPKHIVGTILEQKGLLTQLNEHQSYLPDSIGAREYFEELKELINPFLIERAENFPLRRTFTLILMRSANFV